MLPGNGHNIPVLNYSKLLLTGNGRISIMVALADWYGLPILLQLEKLFSPRDGLPDYWSISTAFAEHAELVVQPI